MTESNHTTEGQEPNTASVPLTGRFGLLGKTLGHSYSPQIHSALGYPDYDLFERQEDELADFFANPTLQGCNITIPYKVNALKACDEVSDIARRIGCVNTMVRHNGGWYGHNTDYDGFRYALRHGNIDVAGKVVLILGDGATSGTIHTAIEDEKAASITHISRKKSPKYEDIAQFYDTADIIINATPVGMYPHSPHRIIDLKPFKHLSGVVDVIYNPTRTDLLLQAETLGIPYVGGLAMLVAQAVYAARLFHNVDIDDNEIAKIVHSMTNAQENIILIGMPGVGKTTVGQALADLTGRTFIDCDDAFNGLYEFPSDYITRHGENSFRIKETAILSSLQSERGLIIATGGGVVTRPENYALLRQNGRMYWLQRPIDDLSMEGRVLSGNSREKLHQLFKVREPLYRQFSQETIAFTDPNEAAQRIFESFQKVR